jgi:hypothetical protein
VGKQGVRYSPSRIINFTTFDSLILDMGWRRQSAFRYMKYYDETVSTYEVSSFYCPIQNVTLTHKKLNSCTVMQYHVEENGAG